MRTLRLNESELWLVSPTGYTDKLDENGYRTGEKVLIYSIPERIRISLYPNNGAVKTFGKGVAVEADYLAVTTTFKLKEDDLLFNLDPSAVWGTSTYPWEDMEEAWNGEYAEDLSKDYDYKVSNILESLNGNRYGLKVKV